MRKEKYFRNQIRGILIKNDGYSIVETDDPRDLLGTEEIEVPALKIGKEGRFYGCVCDMNARTNGRYKGIDTVIVRKSRLLRKDRFFGYVHGPVFIYLNKGLSDDDLNYIRKHICITHTGDTFLMAEDFVDYCYESTDP